ncbi:hypothetical protein [Deinococcus cellulosilyticus]|nr:hypothetical protein [Deinococcus cellulosilyticus]
MNIATQHLRQFLNQTADQDLASLQGPLEHLRLAIELLFPEASPPKALHAPQVFDAALTEQASGLVQQVLKVIEGEHTEEQLGTAKTLLMDAYGQLSGMPSV